MVRFDPYAPPTEPSDPYAGADHTDLYVETLPSPAVRFTGMAAIVTGVVMLFMCVRTLLVTGGSPAALALDGGLVTLGVGYFGVAWGIAGGRVGAAVLAMALTPFAGLASLFVLLTGSVAGMFGGVLAVVDVVLVLVNFGDVQRMARARVAMEKRAA